MSRLLSPDWDDIRAFLAVAEAGTVSGAARALGVTHATMARRVAELEMAFPGPPLFERSRRGYRLTSSGETALRHAREMLAAAEAFTREIADADEMSGAVRVSTTATVAELIAPSLAQFAATHPRIDLQVVIEDRNISIALREADVAVRMGRPTSGEALTRRIGMLSFRLFATAEYLRSTAAEDRRIFTFSEGVGRQNIVRSADELVRAREANLGLPSFRAQAAAALAGTGMALLPTFMVRQVAGLCPADDDEAGWDQDIWVLIHPDSPRFVRVRAVVDAVIDAFKT